MHSLRGGTVLLLYSGASDLACLTSAEFWLTLRSQVLEHLEWDKEYVVEDELEEGVVAGGGTVVSVSGVVEEGRLAVAEAEVSLPVVVV